MVAFYKVYLGFIGLKLSVMSYSLSRLHQQYLTNLMLTIIQSVPRFADNPYVFPMTKLARLIGDARYAFTSIKEPAVQGLDTAIEVVVNGH